MSRYNKLYHDRRRFEGLARLAEACHGTLDCIVTSGA